MSPGPSRLHAERCDYRSGLGHHAAACISPAVGWLDVNGSEVAYCVEHRSRALRLAVLVEVERSDEAELRRESPVLAFPSVVSCPPNTAHAGVVTWALVEVGNACPVCGRYA
jgi:hypothetical protein